MSYKRILVPVDGSPTAAKGLEAAIALAKDGAYLMLLHVIDEYPAFASPEIGVSIAPLLEALRDSGRRVLEGILAGTKGKVAALESELVENFGGRVADVIVSHAADWRADLIVMGTHGRRGINRALLGSDAEIVVRYSPVPVLLVPPEGRAVPPR
jgi:nucleotide-binding universal stress UspA family protein